MPELNQTDRDNALLMLLRNQIAIMRQLDHRLIPMPKSQIGWLADAAEEWLALVETDKRNQLRPMKDD